MAFMPITGADIDRVKDVTAEMMKAFTKHYLITYVGGLVEVAKYNFKNKEPPTALKERPPATEPLYQGWLTKQGSVRKNWKKRYFVILPKGKVEYYEKIEDFEGEKKKIRGEIDLRGYWLQDDVEKGLIEKIKKTMKLLGLTDEAGLIPDKRKYPEFTFELHHWKRRCWFMHPETKEEFDEWCQWMRTGIRSAWWYRRAKDQIMEKSFNKAIYKTRREMGRWGWFNTTGPQAVVIGEMVADNVGDAIMTPIYYKIKGPWKIRNMIRNKMDKTIDGIISGAVGAGWKGVQTSIEQLTPKIQEQLDKGLEPLFQAEEDLKQKIKDAVLDTVTPPLAEIVEPPISKVMDVLVGPVIEAYQEVYRMFDEMTKEMADNVEKNGLKCLREEGKTKDPAYEDIRPMYRHTRSYWKMWDAYNKLEPIREPLYALGDLLRGVYPWRIIYHIRDKLSGILENAVYTFQEDLYASVQADAGNAAAHEAVLMAQQRTMTKLKKDGQEEMPVAFKDIIKMIVVDPFEEKVVPSAVKLVEPLGDMIPDPLKTLINPEETLGDLLVEMIEELIDRLIDPILATKLPKE